MSLTTPSNVQKLQTALHAKAKESPDFRFYALYDKVYRKDVLAHAYERCEANGGAAGVDEQTFEDIERHGVERWLGELTQELKSRTYQPQPVRRVYIPKPDGKQRPLGIPTIRDRVVQTAAVLVLEPIFEADLTAEQYAYRADRSALDAVQHVHKLINTGHGQIVDADLSSYFDSIPHADATSDQDVAGSCGRGNRRPWEQTSECAQSGRRSRDATRVSDQSFAQQSVHATIRAGVEETRAREALESVHRELCR
jgi:RNA-directed DNA polymerase